MINFSGLGHKMHVYEISDDTKLGKSAVTLEDRIRIKRLLNWRNGLKNKMQSSRDKYKLLKKIILFTNTV